MSAEKQTVRVTIFNQTYALRSAGDPRELLEVAASVDELMRSIAQHSGSADPTRAAVLACLHLADQLKLTQAEIGEVQRRVAERAGSLGQILDQA